MTAKLFPLHRLPPRELGIALGLPLACLVWAFWPTLGEFAQRWSHDPQYSHGYLVPGFALALLWLRRDRAPALPLQASFRAGVPVLGAGIALRLVGAYYHFIWLDAISLIPCLIGLCLLMGGRPAWRWAWPSITFLAFMIPLPYRLAVALTDPLQRLATTASTFLLQTLGLPALAEGKIILLGDVQLNVVEACSGLRMLIIFAALATGVVFVVQRPLGDKLVILASAIPIALLVNITRITATGILHVTVGTELANAVFHDWAGWLMMPFALGLLWLELRLLTRLFAAPAAAGPAPLRVGSPGSTRPRVGRTRTPWQKPVTA